MFQFMEGFSDVEDIATLYADDDIKGYNIIIAVYSFGSYEGSSYILAEKNGVLYENTASHCSCYGLEGQWHPGQVTIEYLENRLKNGSFGYICFGGNVVEQQVREYLKSRNA